MRQSAINPAASGSSANSYVKPHKTAVSKEDAQRKRSLLVYQEQAGREALGDGRESQASHRQTATGTVLRRQGNDSAQRESNDPTSTTASVVSPDEKTKDDSSIIHCHEQLSLQTKRRTNKQYFPTVPMSKTAMTQWRRQERRKRNRESAAASRQRVRLRLSHLESEVDEWKAKYTHVMDQIHVLEQELGSDVSSSL